MTLACSFVCSRFSQHEVALMKGAAADLCCISMAEDVADHHLDSHNFKMLT